MKKHELPIVTVREQYMYEGNMPASQLPVQVTLMVMPGLIVHVSLLTAVPVGP